MATDNVRGPAVIDAEAADPNEPNEARRAAEDWAVIERLQARNAAADPDEVFTDVTEAVEEVRQEMYAERQAPNRR